MIFVVLGTQKFQFNRLLKIVDKCITSSNIKEEVFAQIGYSDYIPSNYCYTKFLDKEDFERQIENCSLLITHAGVGTIISGLNHNKHVIVCPRLGKYNEHVDNHQVEIAESFSKKRIVSLLAENEDLGDKINQLNIYKFEKYVSYREKNIDLIDRYLMSLH